LAFHYFLPETTLHLCNTVLRILSNGFESLAKKIAARSARPRLLQAVGGSGTVVPEYFAVGVRSFAFVGEGKSAGLQTVVDWSKRFPASCWALKTSW
jgi:hypothetical protein